MIYVFHGDDPVLLRQSILDIKNSGGASLTDLKSTDLAPSEIASRYLTMDIFGQKSVVSVDVTKDKAFDFPGLFGLLTDKKSVNDLIFYSMSTLPKTHYLIKEASKFKFNVKEFKKEIKVNVFNFLDSLMGKNKREAYKELNVLLEKGDDEFEILGMCVYAIRNLAFCLFESKAFEKLHPFVKSKVKSQAGKFSKEDVRKLYRLFYETDLNLKSGKMEADLAIPLIIEKIAV